MDDFLYVNIEGRYIFKILGKATMKNSKNLSDFIDLNFDEIVDLSFEMSETIYMDSTFLGMIAKIAIELKTKKNKKLVVLNPSQEAKGFLKQTGITKFIDIINEEEIKSESLEAISLETNDNMNDKSRYILEMHEVLMNLNDENKKVFQSVVDAMKKVVK
ncbi:STAS domain-containing protein [Pseudostreptobacillus hongkongensis]|uniref:STAS domain-containing protein n=1 Tax=Pseudostreptobacillus hongkongensis TaxID=1162717 RepID=UPI000829E24C|nr:STAS domain-containing protein [Pseudostreptobacillus hongkongensis]